MIYMGIEVGEIDNIGDIPSLYKKMRGIAKSKEVTPGDIIKVISNKIVNDGILKIRGDYKIDGKEVSAKDFWCYNVYNIINDIKSDNRPKCVECKTRDALWNIDNVKYSRLCANPACKEKYLANFSARMNNVHGVDRLTKKPEFQATMLKQRGIAKDYTFSDGVVKTVIGKIELGGIEVLDKECGIKSDDIDVPAKFTIKYTDPKDGKTRDHIPDMFIHSLNLIVSFKDGMENPNMHPNYQKDRYKSLLEYTHILRDTNYNFIQVEGTEDLKSLKAVISSIKSTFKGGGRYIIPPRIDFLLYKESAEQFISEEFLAAYTDDDSDVHYYIDIFIGRNINETHTRTHMNKGKDVVVLLRATNGVVYHIENKILRTSMLENLDDVYLFSDGDFFISFNVDDHIGEIYKLVASYVNNENQLLPKDYFFRIVYLVITGSEYDSLDDATYEDILDFIDIQKIKVKVKT